ncbi:uncharacterized protein MELLADRAFT_109916 [Melampsora larici-populina 98AG31]|uniref:Uncharacterized protein n=1 Tax=Melampsora larici-populina (strain 98AG31 / pathotype 3-4-7) TaxID=747676 RepID=F4RY24_MELLP|nr:uncharacterized protein MELLADRAFT_109916 [Melampsora larici-populina 98AG31]EGG02716.1 hypothetical protein MELLADRAFT_109916 [Melampsora larici-populina 98AG31]
MDCLTLSGFVKYYTKNSFGGQLKLALSSVTLQAATPFTISTTGTITLTSGPLPNTPIDFTATYTFTGAHPAYGQVQSLDQKVIGIFKGFPQSGAAGGFPSPGVAGASFGGFSIPKQHGE